MKINRQRFLKAAGLAGAGLILAPQTNALSPDKEGSKIGVHSFDLGIASYTFRTLSLDDTITNVKRLGITKLALKSMHMPLDSSAAEIQATAQKVRDAGLDLYGVGVIYMKTDQEVNNAFEYAKHAGVKMIVGVPNHEFLPLVNQKVKEYDIRLAIHNHGPGDDVYKSPTHAYERIENLDKRIGLCIDIGHVVRIKEDPAALAKKYKDRLFDCHLKDEDKAETDGAPVEIGRGVIDIPAFLRTMVKIGFTGNLSLEYEKDGKDPIPGTAESIGYVRGVLKMI
ncbi:MAG: sugar phosphate isomerase/epimerase [Cyclobacteriaceae bacterium]|nr:sugar phosphate isomerase/epimerase [Cyclobacteriaceae bacterium]